MSTNRISGEREPLLSQSRSDSSHNKSADNDADSDPTKLSLRVRNLVLCSTWLGVFLGALDTTIVATLVTSISSSFQNSNQSSWLGTSYLLSTACFTPLYGRLADILGRRGAAMTAITLFTIGTALCGLAPSMNSLIIGRLIAGMGGGGMMAVSSIIASDLVPLKKRALFQGLANLFFGAGAGLGGPFGGFCADRIGWRWAFLIQVPLLVIAFIFMFTFIRYRVPTQSCSKRDMLARIDYGGSATLIVALGALLLGLSWKNNEGLDWSHPKVWVAMTIFGVVGASFVLVEGYWAREPVMPLSLLKQRNGACASVVNFLLSAVSFSVLYFFPMWFEVIKGNSSSRSGAHLLPNSVALSIGSLGAGYIIRHTGKYYWLIIISTCFPLVALSGMALLTPDTPDWVTWIVVMPSGFGFASTVTSVLIALVASVPRAEMATATGLSYLCRYSGQVIGVALSSSVLQAVLTRELRQKIVGPGAPEIIDRIRHVTTSIRTLPPAQQHAALEAYGTGLRAVYIFNVGVGVLTLLAATGLKSYPLPGTFVEEEEAAPSGDIAGSGQQS